MIPGIFKSYVKTAWRNLFKNKTSSLINICGLTVMLATSIIMLVIMNEFSYNKFNTNVKDTYLLMQHQKLADDISISDVTPGPVVASFRNEMPETKYAVKFSYFNNQVMKVDDKTIYSSGIYAEPDLFNIMTFPAIQGNPVADFS